MSTKTLRKRIALVAVSALGFGVMGSVPAFASAEAAAGIVTDVIPTSAAATTPINTNVLLTATIKHGDLATATNFITILGVVTSKPTGSTTTIAAPTAHATITASAGVKSGVTFSATGATASLFRVRATYANDGSDMTKSDSTAVEAAAGLAIGTANFQADKAGSYTIRFWQDINASGTVDAGEQFGDVTVVVASASVGVFNSAIEHPISTNTTDNAGITGGKVNSVRFDIVHSSGRVGVPAVLVPSYQVTANATNITRALNTSNATLRYSLTGPTGSAASLVLDDDTTTASKVQTILGTSNAGLTARFRSVFQQGTALQFTPDVAGTYTLTVFHDADNNEVVNVGETSTTQSIVVAADALPTITMTSYGTAAPGTSAANSALVKVSLKNGTAPASLRSNETLKITSSLAATTTFDETSAWTGLSFAMGDNASGTETTDVSLTRANFDASGNAYITVTDSATSGVTISLSALVAGGTAAGATGSGSVTVAKTSDRAVVVPATAVTNRKGLAFVLANPTTATAGVYGASIVAKATSDGAETYNWYTPTGTATALSLGIVPGVALGATVVGTVTDSSGLITGLKGAAYRIVAQSSTSATTASTASFTGPSVAVGNATADLVGAAVSSTAPAWTPGTGAYSITVTTDEAGGTDSTEKIAVSNANASAETIYVGNTSDGLSSATYSARTVVGAKQTIYGIIYDQFGRILPNVMVTPSIPVTNRNATAATPISLVSDASGLVKYEWTDASTSTTVLSDVLTLTVLAGQVNGGGSLTGTATLNYAAYQPASTITMTTDDSATATATGIAGSVKSEISSADGAEAGVRDVTVVVKDAAGATLPAGVAVTFTVTGNTGAAILSTKQVAYTDDSGKAVSKVYAWKNGNATVTATVGSVTASGIYYFEQGSCTAGTDCTEVRTISATAAGNVVTATVTDRFGNPMKGVNVDASRKGTGTFNGTSSLTGVTDKAGQVQFVLTNGTADVTVAFQTATFGQSAATKGYTNAGITALTAYTAGTAGKAEVGVGASFDAAGVNSATVLAVADTATIDQAAAATDAAAEATDAANAATDAANAAAEAADAATAAAQDAADAVAALSTSVSEMINALKKQITSLTNLVIKIQKKVRA
jgi:trimeric autotransporter adhesin